MEGVQTGLFHESLEEALAEALIEIGARKTVAQELWPHKTAREAHNRLDACLNPNREEKFDASEIVYLLRRAREANSHAAMRFLCESAGYAEPVPVEPEDERAKLQREFIASVALQQRIAERLGVWDKLPSTVRVVK